MKRIVAAVAFACCATANAQEAVTTAQAAPITAPETVTAAAAPQTGKIVVYRQGAMVGLALGCPIRYKEREVVELGRNKYAELNVKPGRYILTNKTSSVQVEVAAGETQYVRCTIKMGMLTGRADLQYADKESFDKQAHEFQKKEPLFTPE